MYQSVGGHLAFGTIHTIGLGGKGLSGHGDVSLMIWLLRVLEIMFFAGLVGCAIVVIISWISIFKDGFSNTDERSSDSHETNRPKER